MAERAPMGVETSRVYARLDAARGISAIVVLLDHANATLVSRITGPQSAALLIGGIAGRHAVLIFFLLSGHLITTSITSNIRRNGEFSARDYMTARLTRIYPPLIGSILICLIVWSVLFAFDLPGARTPFGLDGDLYVVRRFYTMSVSEVFTALTMHGGLLEVNGSLWTLYVEVQLYIVALAVALWWQQDYLARCLGFILGLWAASLLLEQPFMVGVWLVGAATALLAQHRRWWIAATAFAALIVLILEARHTHINGALEEALQEPTLFGFCLLYGGALFFVAPHSTHLPDKIVKTAHFSYSLYIIHMPLLLLALALTQNWVGHSLGRSIFIACIAVSLILFISARFASIAERQSLYKRILRQGIGRRKVCLGWSDQQPASQKEQGRAL